MFTNTPKSKEEVAGPTAPLVGSDKVKVTFFAAFQTKMKKTSKKYVVVFVVSKKLAEALRLESVQVLKTYADSVGADEKLMSTTKVMPLAICLPIQQTETTLPRKKAGLQVSY